MRVPQSITTGWMRLSPRWLPFADAASAELPLSRLLRLGLFQVSVGMAMVLLTGVLNRVLIIELGVAAWLVALMVALPVLFAPLRALIGFRSDVHRSAFGWRRVPFIWFGSLTQFGGFAIMPFALILLSGDTQGPAWLGHAAAALAFLLVGAGLHTTQTAGLALAADIATEDKRPRVVALLYVMLLLGMLGSAFVFGLLLSDFSPLRLIQVVQGAALVTIVLNGIALWKQESRNPARARGESPMPPNLAEAWRLISRDGRTTRFLLVVALGTAGFTMQDILLEPYGAEILGLSVSETTQLTAFLAGGTLCAFAFAARRLTRGADPFRLAALGVLVGIAAFAAVVFSAPMGAPWLFRVGTFAIGTGGGLFAVATLIIAMSLDASPADQRMNGLALGAWGAVQATAAGVAIALGGGLRDVVANITPHLGAAMQGADVPYSVVYHLEIGVLFVTLIVLGPLVGMRKRADQRPDATGSTRFGLAEFPG